MRKRQAVAARIGDAKKQHNSRMNKSERKRKSSFDLIYLDGFSLTETPLDLGHRDALEEMPDLETEDLKAALQYAARKLDHPVLAA